MPRSRCRCSSARSPPRGHTRLPPGSRSASTRPARSWPSTIVHCRKRASRPARSMDVPFHYDHIEALVFGGTLPTRRSFDDSTVVILPAPVDRTTSYVGGTRNGPHEILQASSHMELWDEGMRADVHGVGIFTLPEMELPFGEMQAVVDEIERVAYEVVGRGKFLVTLG